MGKKERMKHYLRRKMKKKVKNAHEVEVKDGKIVRVEKPVVVKTVAKKPVAKTATVPKKATIVKKTVGVVKKKIATKKKVVKKTIKKGGLNA